MSSMKRLGIRKNEDGLVSIVVAVLIMLLLSLIVIAMAQNAGRERRQALDRQLSDQAFYNAESGINDVVSYLYGDSAALRERKTCDLSFLGTDGNIDGEANRYTCVMYDKDPSTIEIDDLDTASSKTFPIEALDNLGNPRKINTLEITWDDWNGNNVASGCNFVSGNTPLPTRLPDNCEIGGVRLDVVNTTNTDNRADLMRRTSTSYLLPHATSGGTLQILGAGYYPDNQGLVSQANCSGGVSGRRTCSVKIEQIDLERMAIHIKALYKSVDVTICGSFDTVGCASSQAVNFNNAQIMVDATGKATDILRRVQVRIPAQPQYRNAEFALQSKDSICKLIEVRRYPDNAQSIDSTRCPIDDVD